MRRVTSADPRSELIAQPSIGSIARNYNLLRERAADHDELEALVLIHQDVEIVDQGFSSEVREALADPEVAVVGAPAPSACAASPGGRGRSPGRR